jgi:CheY-like chemotaxis protein
MTSRPRILCLDDEPFVLDGLKRNLRAAYTVETTTDPREALELLADGAGEPISVIVSDMRMPGMTGVAVLEEASEVSPDTTRVLLTGDADVEGAVAAINQGHVFRFLLKPCPVDALRETIAAAAEQHRLMRAERELLQDTLKGCIDALMDTLAMAQPALFSRAGRLRRLVEQTCAELELPDAWQVEMAAQLGEIGAITLPPTAMVALQTGLATNDSEADMLAALPRLANTVLAKIPRIEAVREIIAHQLPTDRSPVTPLRSDAPDPARLLQVVREYDTLIFRGMPPDLVLATLAFRKIHLDEHLTALAKVAGMRLPNEAVREITVDELSVGHELASDLRSAKGLLLVSRGQVITERLRTRVQNFEASTGLEGKILVIDG